MGGTAGAQKEEIMNALIQGFVEEDLKVKKRQTRIMKEGNKVEWI